MILYRFNDFYLKNIYNTKEECLGKIIDVYIDFQKSLVLGFKVCNNSLVNKETFYSLGDVFRGKNEEHYNNKKRKFIKFSEIIGLDVVDKVNNYKGKVKDLLIDKNNFFIKGYILDTGIKKDIFEDEIILPDECVLGDNFIVFLGNGKIKVRNINHLIGRNAIYKKA